MARERVAKSRASVQSSPSSLQGSSASPSKPFERTSPFSRRTTRESQRASEVDIGKHARYGPLRRLQGALQYSGTSHIAQALPEVVRTRERPSNCSNCTTGALQPVNASFLLAKESQHPSRILSEVLIPPLHGCAAGGRAEGGMTVEGRGEDGVDYGDTVRTSG